MRLTTTFNDAWLFEGRETVRLPHTAVELPYSYFDEGSYQRPFRYEKTFAYDPAWDGREVRLRFDGAMADSAVTLNGVPAGEHKDGYTPFTLRLTESLKAGDNRIKVHIDGSENPAIPPFGAYIDYLTYAGIYRDVWLEVVSPVSIGLTKIETPDVLAAEKSVSVAVTLDNPRALAVSGQITAAILDAEGVEVAQTTATVAGESLSLRFEGLKNIALWDIDTPNLYRLRLTLDTPHGADETTTTFGFRAAEFRVDGFFLNGRRLKLRGLNRHQSFPYTGYAMGRAAQERDAEILKHELHLNIVRTSHYPQSKWFLDHCDRIGLLCFEEIPGWQHIGDKDWQAASVDNVRAMITRDWNHPSIILWGVRINESQDSHDFYLETNRVAHELDTTRQTGGVRYLLNSELLEDVYTLNDFYLGQDEMFNDLDRRPLRGQQEATGLKKLVPYMITEYMGHMFPTKSHDQEQRQAEHVWRHLQILNHTYGDPQIAGCIGWCAWDYNTHKDFGSGDRICHHGVMDMFREPKFAAHAYASQCEPSEAVVMEPVTFYARGERNIGGILPLIILTNCDAVELHYGNNPAKRIEPDRQNFPHLPHPPVVLDRRHLTDEELGVWGMSWEHGRIVGYLNGEVVAERHFVADPLPTTLQVAPDAIQIHNGDQVRVMIRALDQVGNKLPFLSEPATVEVTGAGRRIGPKVLPLRGGSTGLWVEGTGAGTITITVSHDRFDPVTVTIASE